MWLGLAAGLIGPAIVHAIIKKETDVELTECRRCRRRRVLALVVSWTLAIVLAPGLPILLGIIGGSYDRREGGLIGIGAGFLLWLVVVVLLHFVWLPRAMPVCKRIDDLAITLGFPDPAATRRAISASGASPPAPS